MGLGYSYSNECCLRRHHNDYDGDGAVSDGKSNPSVGSRVDKYDNFVGGLGNPGNEWVSVGTTGAGSWDGNVPGVNG